jgi:hypothetical protein
MNTPANGSWKILALWAVILIPVAWAIVHELIESVQLIAGR